MRNSIALGRAALTSAGPKVLTARLAGQVIKDDLTQCRAISRLSVVVRWETGPLISFSASQLGLILMVAGRDFKKERAEVPKPFRTGTIPFLSLSPPPPFGKQVTRPAQEQGNRLYFMMGGAAQSHLEGRDE